MGYQEYLAAIGRYNSEAPAKHQRVAAAAKACAEGARSNPNKIERMTAQIECMRAKKGTF